MESLFSPVHIFCPNIQGLYLPISELYLHRPRYELPIL